MLVMLPMGHAYKGFLVGAYLGSKLFEQIFAVPARCHDAYINYFVMQEPERISFATRFFKNIGRIIGFAIGALLGMLLGLLLYLVDLLLNAMNQGYKAIKAYFVSRMGAALQRDGVNANSNFFIKAWYLGMNFLSKICWDILQCLTYLFDYSFDLRTGLFVKLRVPNPFVDGISLLGYAAGRLFGGPIGLAASLVLISVILVIESQLILYEAIVLACRTLAQYGLAQFISEWYRSDNSIQHLNEHGRARANGSHC